MNFACGVIISGRPFLRRLINLTIGIKKSFHHIRITKEAKADLRLWLRFIAVYNGCNFFVNEKFISSNALKLFTDASSLGFGATYGDKWLYGEFTGDIKHRNITIVEFYPILIALQLWGDLWSNHSILFFTDNEALVSIINRQSSKEEVLMQMVRWFVLKCLTLNLNFKAKHIPGKLNTKADSLSRLQLRRFRELAPTADSSATSIPQQLLPRNFFRMLLDY